MSGVFFLAARYKGKSSEVTGSNAALFEINQIYGPSVLTTSAFVISWMSFPVAWTAFWWLGVCACVGGYNHQEK